MPIIIGVDIGGTHITSSGVNSGNFEIIQDTCFTGKVNSKDSKENVLQSWANVINKTIDALDLTESKGIGISFAIPGPFDYENGIALYEKNDKYENLYGCEIKIELASYLNYNNIEMRFLNDASSFGLGGTLTNDFDKSYNRVVSITLGTGFGSAFFVDKIPVNLSKKVPENGCLWDKEYKESMADDYFSARWFVARYSFLSGKNGIKNVKEIVDLDDKYTQQVFLEFSNNLAEFLLPYLLNFETDLLLIGGNISKSHHLFLNNILEVWKSNHLNLPVKIIENTEETIIIGSAYLFNKSFWLKIKDELPQL